MQKANFEQIKPLFLLSEQYHEIFTNWLLHTSVENRRLIETIECLFEQQEELMLIPRKQLKQEFNKLLRSERSNLEEASLIYDKIIAALMDDALPRYLKVLDSFKENLSWFYSKQTENEIMQSNKVTPASTASILSTLRQLNEGEQLSPMPPKRALPLTELTQYERDREESIKLTEPSITLPSQTGKQKSPSAKSPRKQVNQKVPLSPHWSKLLDPSLKPGQSLWVTLPKPAIAAAKKKPKPG